MSRLLCFLRRSGREYVVVVALLGQLGGRGEVGRDGRHGELFIDAGDARVISDPAGFCLDWEDIPSLSTCHFLLFCFLRRGVAKRKNGVDVDLI